MLPLAEAGKFARARRRSRREPQVRAPHSHAAQPAQRLRPVLTPNNRPSLASTRCHSHSKATRRASSRVRRPVQGGTSRCAHPCVTLHSLRGAAGRLRPAKLAALHLNFAFPALPSYPLLSWHVLSCPGMTFPVPSCHVMSFHVISCHDMSCYGMSYAVMSCHVI